MSDPVRIALVAEGPTDKIVIGAAIRNILGETPFILQQLQPEESLAFVSAENGTGWGGVYRWCRKAARPEGIAQTDILFATYRALVLHLDAEVAAESYANAGIVQDIDDLPCAEPCPPAASTTGRLRNVMLRWLGQRAALPRIVLCTPSKSTETWVLCALYPADRDVVAGRHECLANPHHRLQSKPHKGRLVTGNKKQLNVYKLRYEEISAAWPTVRSICIEAERFSSDLEQALIAAGGAHPN